MGWPVCRWAWIPQGVNQIDLGDAPGMASSGAMDSEQVIRITLTIVTPILTAGFGIVALVIGDWRERRTRHGRRKLSVEDAGRQVTFAEDYFDSLTTYREGNPASIVEKLAEASFAAIANGRRLVLDLRAIREGWTHVVAARRGARPGGWPIS